MNSYPLSDAGLTIFLFHGVLKSFDYEIRNYTRKHIEADYFERLLIEWSQSGTPLSMDEVIDYARRGVAFPPRSFAITFDDGFLNNLTVAAPVLARMKLPATFYVTSGFIDQNAMSWVDRMEWAMERHSSGTLSLPWRTGPVTFSSVAERISIMDEIRRVAKSDRSVNRDDLAVSINRNLGETPVVASPDPLDQKMTWTQVRELGSNPLFLIGGHSHTHPILSFLNDSELKAEIDQSLELLAKHLGYRTHHYAYPEGLSHCFDERVISLLKQGGVHCCPTAISGVNTNEDLFHLLRVMVV